MLTAIFPATEGGGRCPRKLKARRLTDEEGQRVLPIVRRGHRYNATTWRRAMIIMASASGHEVKVIANLVQTGRER